MSEVYFVAESIPVGGVLGALFDAARLTEVNIRDKCILHGMATAAIEWAFMSALEFRDAIPDQLGPNQIGPTYKTAFVKYHTESKASRKAFCVMQFGPNLVDGVDMNKVSFDFSKGVYHYDATDL
jgi:hypothetical protein